MSRFKGKGPFFAEVFAGGETFQPRNIKDEWHEKGSEKLEIPPPYPLQKARPGETGAPEGCRRTSRLENARGDPRQGTLRSRGRLGSYVFQLLPEEVGPPGLFRPDLVPGCFLARPPRKTGSDRTRVDRNHIPRNGAAGGGAPGRDGRNHRSPGQAFCAAPNRPPDNRRPGRGVSGPPRNRETVAAGGLDTILPPLIDRAVRNGELPVGVDRDAVLLGLSTIFFGLPVFSRRIELCSRDTAGELPLSHGWLRFPFSSTRGAFEA